MGQKTQLNSTWIMFIIDTSPHWDGLKYVELEKIFYFDTQVGGGQDAIKRIKPYGKENCTIRLELCVQQIHFLSIQIILNKWNEHPKFKFISHPQY